MKYFYILLIFCCSFSLQAQKNIFPSMTQGARDSLLDIPNGFAILNLNTGCLNYYFNQKWKEICGTCTPQMPIVEEPSISPNTLSIKVKNPVQQVIYVAYTQPKTQQIKDSTGIFLFTKMKNATFYTLYLYAENDCGKSPIAIDTFTFRYEDNCKGETSFIDTRNQKLYTIQTIGNACWMTEDLVIKAEKNAEIYLSNEGKTYISQNYLHKNQETICPNGWHIPSKEEAEDLKKYIYLVQDNTFSKGNGAYDFADKTLKVPEYLYFWTQSLSENKEAMLVMINHQNMTFIPTKDKMGLSIRCVKNTL